MCSQEIENAHADVNLTLTHIQNTAIAFLLDLKIQTLFW